MFKVASGVSRQVCTNTHVQRRFACWTNKFASQRSKIFETSEKAIKLECENHRLIEENMSLQKKVENLSNSQKASNFAHTLSLASTAFFIYLIKTGDKETI